MHHIPVGRKEGSLYFGLFRLPGRPKGVKVRLHTRLQNSKPILYVGLAERCAAVLLGDRGQVRRGRAPQQRVQVTLRGCA